MLSNHILIQSTLLLCTAFSLRIFNIHGHKIKTKILVSRGQKDDVTLDYS